MHTLLVSSLAATVVGTPFNPAVVYLIWHLLTRFKPKIKSGQHVAFSFTCCSSQL